MDLGERLERELESRREKDRLKRALEREGRKRKVPQAALYSNTTPSTKTRSIFTRVDSSSTTPQIRAEPVTTSINFSTGRIKTKADKESEPRHVPVQGDSSTTASIKVEEEQASTISAAVIPNHSTDHASASFTKRRRTNDDDQPARSSNSIAASYSGLKSATKRSKSDNENNGREESSRSGYAPARKGPRARGKQPYVSKTTIETRPDARNSKWYSEINMKEKFPRSNLVTLQHFRDLVRKCVDAVRNGEDPTEKHDNLRRRLHEMEFYSFLNGALIKKSKVLESDGLEAIYDDLHDIDFPWDLKADALALSIRWLKGDIDPHLLRGVDTSKTQFVSGAKRTSYKLDKNHPARRPANVVGNNGLLNGQWWPIRVCAMRDGAHGEQEAGIYGEAGKGAYSVVVASGGYADRDDGDVCFNSRLFSSSTNLYQSVEYCGTESQNSTTTRHTLFLLQAYDLKQPVRLLRAENKNSKYAPEKGLRYDGLYDIVGKGLLDDKTAMWRFSLRRQAGQDPIRFEGVEARPTGQELAEMKVIRETLATAVV
jgi:hypothetical protein